MSAPISSADLASLLIVEDVRYAPRKWSWEIERITEAPLDTLPPTCRRVPPVDRRRQRSALASGHRLHIVVAVAVDVVIVRIDAGKSRLLPGVQRDRLLAAVDRLQAHHEHVAGGEGAEARPRGEKTDLDRLVQRRLGLLALAVRIIFSASTVSVAAQPWPASSSPPSSP